LELGVRQLDRDDRGQTLTGVLAGRRLLEILPEASALGVGVDGARERALEADQVASTLVGVDVVGERVDALVVRVVPLHRDLDRDAVLLRLEEDRRVEDILRLVEELDEADDAALELEEVAL